MRKAIDVYFSDTYGVTFVAVARRRLFSDYIV